MHWSPVDLPVCKALCPALAPGYSHLMGFALPREVSRLPQQSATHPSVPAKLPCTLVELYKFSLYLSSPTRGTPTILHQPQISRFRVIFRKNLLFLNGISVSRPPKIGERPYPRQFHPVEFTRFQAIFPPLRSHPCHHSTHPSTHPTYCQANYPLPHNFH